MLGLRDISEPEIDPDLISVKVDVSGYGVGGEIKEALIGVTETTFGLPLDTYSGNIQGNIAGKAIDAWRLDETFLKQFDVSNSTH